MFASFNNCAQEIGNGRKALELESIAGCRGFVLALRFAALQIAQFWECWHQLGIAGCGRGECSLEDRSVISLAVLITH